MNKVNLKLISGLGHETTDCRDMGKEDDKHLMDHVLFVI